MILLVQFNKVQGGFEVNNKRKVNWYLLGLIVFLTISTVGISIYSWFLPMGIHQRSDSQLDNIAKQYQRDINNHIIRMDAELIRIVDKYKSQLEQLDTSNPEDLEILTDLIDYQFREITQYRYYFGAVTPEESLIGYLYKSPEKRLLRYLLT